MIQCFQQMCQAIGLFAHGGNIFHENIFASICPIMLMANISNFVSFVFNVVQTIGTYIGTIGVPIV